MAELTISGASTSSTTFAWEPIATSSFGSTTSVGPTAFTSSNHAFVTRDTLDAVKSLGDLGASMSTALSALNSFNSRVTSLASSGAGDQSARQSSVGSLVNQLQSQAASLQAFAGTSGARDVTSLAADLRDKVTGDTHLADDIAKFTAQIEKVVAKKL
ncbi:MAG: hypothetical protein FJZ01_15670 [Candidatus Sericytochromatia bacterium]|nr:hypothetical protein [Candidatus Tanganyikabacteria bacterium]